MKRLIFVLLLAALPCTVSANEDYFGNFDYDRSLETINGGGELILGNELWENIYGLLTDEISDSIALLIDVTVISIIYLLLASADSREKKGELTRAAGMAVYASIFIISIDSFNRAFDVGADFIGTVTAFSNTTIPVIGAFIAASGNLAVISAMSPVVLFSINLTENLVTYLVLPALLASVLVFSAGSFCKIKAFAELSKLIRKISVWSVTAITTIYCAVIGAVKIYSGTLGGVAAKGIKFAVSSLIPVLGGVLSDSAEAVAGGAILLKNSAGTAALIFIIMSLLVPVIKLSVIAVVYKLSSAVLMLLKSSPPAELLGDFCDTICVLIALCVLTAAMSIVSLSLLLGASDMGAALR